MQKMLIILGTYSTGLLQFTHNFSVWVSKFKMNTVESTYNIVIFLPKYPQKTPHSWPDRYPTFVNIIYIIFVMISCVIKRLHCMCLPFSIVPQQWNRVEYWRFSLKEDKTPHSPHHGWWWPGDARSQGIYTHDIDWVLCEYSGLSTTRVYFINAAFIK